MLDPTPPAGSGGHHPVGRIVTAVVGGLAVLLGVVLLIAGSVLVVGYGTQRDDDGFFTSDEHRLETVGHAITSDEVDLGTRRGRGDGVELGDLATVRITADPVGDGPVFVGIGPEAEVARYLDGVEHAVITDVHSDPFSIAYRYHDGGAPTGPPAEEGFWVAAAEGTGPQSVEWDLETGRYVAVLMNADGSSGVAVETSVGVEADWVLPAGILLLVGAVLLLVGGAAAVVAGAHGIAGRTPSPAPAPTASPVALVGHLEGPPRRWLWLVKPILVIPHVVVLAVLWVVAAVLTMGAGVAILVTGRYPRPIFDVNVGVLRWTWRVAFYSFGAFATDRYPPFTLGPATDYPAVLEVRYPESLSRGLVLVKWWLLAIPHYVVLGILGVGLAGSGRDTGGIGLVPWLAMVAGVVLLFAGRYPKGLFDLLVGLHRWTFRVLAYAMLMTDEYPPFRLDQGPSEPELVAPTTG